MISIAVPSRTYKNFGLIAKGFARTFPKTYVDPLMNIFADTYSTVHRLETEAQKCGQILCHIFSDAIG